MLNRRIIAYILIVASILVPVGIVSSRPFLASVAQATPNQSPLFEDHYGGTGIDSNKWNNSFATSGLRWCSVGIPSASNLTPGVWQDASVTPCNGQTQSTPYGSLNVGGGQASFSASSSRGYPYIFRGQPSKSSPFPATGNFVLEVRMQFNVITGNGAGFAVSSYSNTDPVGDNPTVYPRRILTIWDDSLGLRVGLFNQTAFVQDYYGTGIHDYVMAYVEGQYSVFVDGLPLIQPVTSNVRANAIWIGNPFFAFWAIQNWTSFSLSLVRVTVPSVQATPDTGPPGTKVLVQGSNIPYSQVEVTFDDNFLGFTSTSNGSFNFTLDVPLAAPGQHSVRAVVPILGSIADASFQVLPAEAPGLSVGLRVGQLYFPGDTAIMYVLITQGGTPVSSTGLKLQATVTTPSGAMVTLNFTSVGVGTFRATYGVPKSGSVGTYAVTAAATLGPLHGADLQTFEVKPSWLSSQGQTIVSAGTIAGVVAVAAIVWRKGYFRKSSEDSF